MLRRFLMVGLSVLLTAVVNAESAWTLTRTGSIPGSFWTISSPDGQWKLSVVPSNHDEIDIESACEADLVVTGWYCYWDEWEEEDEEVAVSDVFDTGYDEECVLKGSGVLTLPSRAVDANGNSYTVEFGDWTLLGDCPAVKKITQCVIPASYDQYFGEGASILADFEVSSENDRYYAQDGVLYLREGYRDDGGEGDVLLQCPASKKGTFAIPQGVTKVRSGAFTNSRLTELVIGSDLVDFEHDQAVSSTLKKVTVPDNERFVYANGLLLGDYGASVALCLPGVLSGSVSVPASVSEVGRYRMNGLSTVTELVFTSADLTIANEAFEGTAKLHVLDFSGVENLTLQSGSLEDVNEQENGGKTSVFLPAQVSFADGGLWIDEEDGGVSDIYWPTASSYYESSLEWISTEMKITLHLLKTAGDWSGASWRRVTIVKDMEVPATPVVSGFLEAGSRVGVAVSGTVKVSDYASLKVSGLPSGVKVAYDKKGTATFSGAATKAGTYTVTVSYAENGRTMTKPYSVVIGKAPHLEVTVEAGEGGTVKGGGDVYAGKKITVTAKADANKVFAGWYQDGGPYEADGVDYRTPSLTIVNTSEEDDTLALYAEFIDLSEDWASVDAGDYYELETKQPIDPISIDVESGSLATVKVTGLPAGLKFTAKALDVKATKTTEAAHYEANTIYGTPTKSGVYTATVTATTAGKATDTCAITFVVRTADEKCLVADYDATMGKVSGAGIYAAGKKVTLKATANAAKKATKTTPAQEATVFAGWYADAYFDTPLEGASDYRSTSFAYEMPEDDTTVYARFVSASEDAEIGLSVEESEVTDNPDDAAFYTSGEAYLALDVRSLSAPKIAVSGLPAGLKFTAKQVLNKDKSVLAEANTIYGTAKKPGLYVVTVKLTNATVKKAVEKKFSIVVDNLTGANALLRGQDDDETRLRNEPGTDEKYVILIGMEADGLPTLQLNERGTIKVTGLPSGLKYTASTGKITGTPTKAGSYTVYVTVGSLVSTFTLVVEALPSWAVGTFEGYMYEQYRDYYDADLTRCSWTISAKGELSYAESAVWEGAVHRNSGKCKLTSADDGAYEWTWHEYGPNGSWGDTLKTVRVYASEIDGVTVGVLEGSNEGYDSDDAYISGYIKGVQTPTSGEASLVPAVLSGTVTSIPIEGWRENDDWGYTLYNWFLQLKYGKKGSVTAALFAPESWSRATATCSGQLVVYDYTYDNEDGHEIQRCFVTLLFACRNGYSIGMVLYLDVDCSHDVVYGDDVELADYLLQCDYDD